jgi:alpha-glucuronidase
MTAEGYTPADVRPWETASSAKAVVCGVSAGCTLTAKLDKPAGSYNVVVQYFDYWSGRSHFELQVDGRTVGQWVADDTLPPARIDLHPDGETSTRITFHDVALKPGDTLMLRGVPDDKEPAPVDYVEITPGTKDASQK